MANLKIREVAQSDLRRWQSLWTGYNAFYERTIPDQITEVTWSRFLDCNEPVHALVAEYKNELLGFAHFIFHRTTSSTEEVCYLQDLFTSKKHRRQGVASQLMQAVYKHAKSSGSSRVYWLTHESNADAMRLYDRMGERSGFEQYRKNL